ncbi:twin-arginine translocase TatA/TatE family subunit [Paenibacillus taichungensis]|uniref:Sec-independent protein translocase protein TatA n=1 Tax=Paenibacillus taichungensis TaxID=484184 RepID=A0ABX2MWR5_9BACL|nr:twin-arginine translocase TatA/TatE family subunit [Paenibacillus taichungensis]MEC0106690.1 twin-arginine translocase TatA/TatE family subunit [Paenibacillus taichungensis]MEC0195381.1 twin-arginine translocase TatA/TatE family subunit [Paenibacillus taichungensis]NUU58292.1 twin-arginine translocase TatA/TatE family subunit [Paenibacillus taichungensis]OME77856.1 Sec-independent protein translocase TatA [Paenibacillus pabuli]
MLSSIGPTGFILLAVIALLLFGPNKLPELGRAVGRTFREFKEGAREIISDDDSSSRKEQEKAKPLASETASTDKPEDKRLPE